MNIKEATKKVLWQWKVLEYLSYFVIFLVPLYFNNKYQLFVFGSPKTILIIGVVLLMTIIYSWGILVEKKLSFRFTPLHIILGIFLIALTLSSIFGIDPLNSFFGRWREGISLVLIYAVTIFAFLIAFLVKKNKLFLPRILLASFISSLFVLIISYTSIFGKQISESGTTTLGNNSYAGAYLLFSACFGIGLFFYYSKIWQKISIAIGTFIIVLSPVFFNKGILLGKIGFSAISHNPFLLFGSANAATLGLAVSFLIIISLFLTFSSKKIIKIIGIILLFSALAGILYTGFQLVNSTSSIHSIYTKNKGENRFVTWDIAQSSFYGRPLLGSGFNNFSYNYQKYFSADILKERFPEFYFNQPHNIIWEYASSGGALGLASFFLLLLFTFLALFQSKENEEKKDRNIKIALIGILFGYFIQNLFGFDTPAIYLMLFLLIGIAIGESKKEWIFLISDGKNNRFKFLSILVIIFSLVSMVLFVILPKKELKRWGKINSANNIKEQIVLRQGMQEISLFGGVNDSVYLETKFFDEYKANLNKINDSNRSLYLEELQSIISQVEKDIEKQPRDVSAHILAGELINMDVFVEKKINEEIWSKAEGHLKTAINLNPRNPEIYYILAQTYALKKDFENARLAVREAIMAAPEYKNSYEFAKRLLELDPNNNFKNYINEMENKWISR